MDRSKGPIDRAKVRAAVRRLGKDYAHLVLDDAIELLPQAALAQAPPLASGPQLFGPYDVKTLSAEDRDAPAASPRASVEAFARTSLAGEYYEPFDVDSRNDVVFFADEGGSWQVGVDWEVVLPAWFVALSATAQPEEFARLVVERVSRHCSHGAAGLLASAGRAAAPAQRAAMQRLPVTSAPGREIR